MQRGNRRGQGGFGLPDIVIAALCFSISLLGLLQYHQLMQQAFLRQWEQQQAWRVAYQQLSVYAAGQGTMASTLAGRGLPAEWRLSLTEQQQTVMCRRVTSTVITPQQYQAQLVRWFCTSPNGTAV